VLGAVIQLPGVRERFRTTRISRSIWPIGFFPLGLNQRAKGRQLGLLADAIFASRICNAGDYPFAVDANKIEQVGSAVVHVAVD
jgi:hypothetical protein